MVFVGDSTTTTITKANVLRVFPALPTNYTLNVNSTNFTTYVTYSRLGMVANNDVGATFVFCANSDESKARAIAITRTRPRIAVATETFNDCGSP